MVGSNGRCFESDEFEIHIVILYEIFESARFYDRLSLLLYYLLLAQLFRNVIVALFTKKRITYLLTCSYKFVRRKKVVLPDSEFQDALERTIPQLCRFFLL